MVCDANAAQAARSCCSAARSRSTTAASAAVTIGSSWLPAARRARRAPRRPTARAGRPVLDHRAVGVDGGDDPRLERDPVAGEAVRVAGAVDALVVVAHRAPRCPRGRRSATRSRAPKLRVRRMIARSRRRRAGRASSGSRRGRRPCRRRAGGPASRSAAGRSAPRPSSRATAPARSATCSQCRKDSLSRTLGARRSWPRRGARPRGRSR